MNTLESNTAVNDSAVLENQIAREAERTIAATCEKHSVTREQLKPEHISEAYSFARTKILEERQRKSDPVFQSLLEAREQNRLLSLQLEAVKSSRSNTGNEHVSVTEADTVRARLGNATWFQLTTNGKLQAIGVDPQSVTATTKQEIKDLFGKGASSQHASDYIRQNKQRYLTLREIGRVLDLIGR